jgi:hypothetical protein
MVIKKWIKNKWVHRSLFVLIGALGYFIGCTGNACPITSNPYISIGYGSLIGFVLSAVR